MYRTRIKICGITNLQDAKVAIDEGVDAIGLVFCENSPRYINISRAKKIVENTTPFVNYVGLFVDAEKEYINDVLKEVALDTLQFHGQESEQACALYNKPYIKAIRMNKNINLSEEAEKYFSAHALLLDTYIEGLPGGTGIVFDWDLIPKDIAKPIILAGGLNASNVKDAIKKISPYAVDVSGGVEAEKGKKDPSKIKEFINEVMNV